MAAFNGEPSSIRVMRMLAHPPKVSTSIPRYHRAAGGGIPDSPLSPFSGPILSSVPGRTDHIPVHVPDGSYVIPADIVSAIGEGNSLNGLQVLKERFSAQPYGASAGPYGSSMPKGGRGGAGGLPNAPVPQYAGGLPQKTFAAGGAPAHTGKPTPIVAAGGEFVIHPADVMQIGGGSIKKGHKILDAWVKSKRKETIQTLKKLPGPARG